MLKRKHELRNQSRAFKLGIQVHNVFKKVVSDIINNYTLKAEIINTGLF